MGIPIVNVGAGHSGRNRNIQVKALTPKLNGIDTAMEYRRFSPTDMTV